MSNLIDRKCEPCSGNTPKLSLDEVQKKMLEINDWKLNDKKEMIFKKFKFKNFIKSLQFTNEVGNISENLTSILALFLLVKTLRVASE